MPVPVPVLVVVLQGVVDLPGSRCEASRLSLPEPFLWVVEVAYCARYQTWTEQRRKEREHCEATSQQLFPAAVACQRFCCLSLLQLSVPDSGSP